VYLAIATLPVLASLTGLVGRSLGATGVNLLTTGCITVTALLSLVAYHEVALCGSPVTVYLGGWADCDSMTLHWSLTYDDLTVSMLLPVLTVSSLVHLYSISYMAEDPHAQRFMSLLSLFTASMVVLVTGDSYGVLFVGWEGIGVASFLLIGYWLTRAQAGKSATQAMTVNRVGDAVLSVGFMALVWSVGGLDYASVLSVAPQVSEGLATVIGLLLFGGAMSKSAQVPLHTWLPTAMEGPTPVSALIHAATLVTAGVYLLLRSSPLLEHGPTALLVITWVGALTALYAASTGLLQNDLKRVIAYSTCSQLGYMMMALGLSQYATSLYHLVGHAFFKALLFLSAGAIIHGLADQQDLRRLGGLLGLLPFTYTAMVVGSLSLMALPWLTGFYTKDAILELAGAQYTVTGSVAYWAGTLSAGLTAFYSFRLLALTFMTTPSAPKVDYEHAHEAPVIVIVPLLVLSVLAIGFGYLARDLYLGPGTDYLSHALPLSPTRLTLVEAEFGSDLWVKLLPAVLSVSGAGLALSMYTATPEATIALGDPSSVLSRVYTFLNGRWGLDTVITSLLIVPGVSVGLSASKVVDRGLIELVGPHGLSVSLPGLGRSVARLDTGVITTYAVTIMLSALTLALVLFAPILIDQGTVYGGGADVMLGLVYLCCLSVLAV
jgi:NADH-ubiquinone oxidoreductase chain 5